MDKFTVTIELPRVYEVATTRVDDEAAVIPFDQIPAHCLAEMLVRSSCIVVGNVFNGGGKDVAKVEKLANARKRIDGWVRGEWTLSTRGDAMSTLMDEAYRAKLEGALGTVTDAAYRAFKESTIKEATGKALAKGEKLTFDLFLSCRAKVVAKASKRDATEVEAELTAELETAAKAIAAERAKAMAAIDTTGLDF